MNPDTLQAYHFTGTHLRDGRPIPKVGKWLRHAGPVVPCKSGLHASLHPFDALFYAPSNHLHLVEVEGDIQHHCGDKLVARNRRILKSFDAEKLLREFARWNALQVIHLWKAPQVVKEYLETGDENLREAASAAALAAADAADAADTASYAAYAAADAADTASYAAYAAADAARAAYDAAYAAAYAAYAAADATRAAHAAAHAAYDAASYTAARTAARDKFKQMVDEAFDKLP